MKTCPTCCLPGTLLDSRTGGIYCSNGNCAQSQARKWIEPPSQPVDAAEQGYTVTGAQTTSVQAGKKARRRQESMWRTILDRLFAAPAGETVNEIGLATGWNLRTIAGRCSDLHSAGALRVLGTRINEHGNPANAYAPAVDTIEAACALAEAYLAARGKGQGRENLQARIAKLEQENAALRAELEELRAK